MATDQNQNQITRRDLQGPGPDSPVAAPIGFGIPDEKIPEISEEIKGKFQIIRFFDFFKPRKDRHK